jgi:SOS-response transcriptional repressor LexA
MATKTLGELTPRQREVFGKILAYMVEHGCPPTVREVAGFVGSDNPTAGVYYLKSLHIKGWIAWGWYVDGASPSRSIKIRVGEVCDACRGLGRVIPDDL